MSEIIFTIGHSNGASEHLLELLGQHGVTAVADVRSRPYSRFNPQFNRETLANELKKSGREYFSGSRTGSAIRRSQLLPRRTRAVRVDRSNRAV